MSIEGIKASFQGFKGIQGIKEYQQASGVKGAEPEKKGFSGMLSDALKEVDGLQIEADKKSEDLALGKAVTPHDAMIALEKADIAFQLMGAVRTKIVRAYEEIMRTQV